MKARKVSDEELPDEFRTRWEPTAEVEGLISEMAPGEIVLIEDPTVSSKKLYDAVRHRWHGKGYIVHKISRRVYVRRV